MLLVTAEEFVTLFCVEFHSTNNREQQPTLIHRSSVYACLQKTLETVSTTIFDDVNYGTYTTLTEIVHRGLRDIFGVGRFQE